MVWFAFLWCYFRCCGLLIVIFFIYYTVCLLFYCLFVFHVLLCWLDYCLRLFILFECYVFSLAEFGVWCYLMCLWWLGGLIVVIYYVWLFVDVTSLMCFAWFCLGCWFWFIFFWFWLNLCLFILLLRLRSWLFDWWSCVLVVLICIELATVWVCFVCCWVIGVCLGLVLLIWFCGYLSG